MLRRLLIHMGLVAPPLFGAVDDMKAGQCMVRGRIRTTTPLTSPIGQQECAAFWYQAWFTGIRGSGGSVKRIRSVLGYAPNLMLEVDGGEIALGGDKPSGEGITRGEHLRLEQGNIHGFKSREQLIFEGDEVQVRGEAKWSDAEFVWRLDPFVLVLEKPADAPVEETIDEGL